MPYKEAMLLAFQCCFSETVEILDYTLNHDDDDRDGCDKTVNVVVEIITIVIVLLLVFEF